MSDREEERRRLIAHYSGKAKDLDSQLSPDLKAAVVGLAPKMLKQSVAASTIDRLVSLGLAERKLGGACLTTLGEFVARLNGSRV